MRHQTLRAGSDGLAGRCAAAAGARGPRRLRCFCWMLVHVVAVGGLLASRVATGAIATAVAAGAQHTCAVTGHGAVQCWGENSSGQLGDGTTTDRATPVPVSGFGSGAVAVTAGEYHTCALTSAGAVWCWGANDSGQLGDGTMTNRLTPVIVTGLTSGVVAVGAGYGHTCAVTGGGALLCWGGNWYGQLGNGISGDHLTPVAVSGLGSGVAAVAVGGEHTCALTSGGAVQCWGANQYGQLGDGTTTQRQTPVGVSGLTSGVAAVAAGGAHTCALTSAGAAWCWGVNYGGRLGDGTTTDRWTPVAVSGLGSGVVAVAASGSHTCAVTSGGGLQCWGSNYYGQVGDGTITDRWTPVTVSGLASGVVSVASAVGLHTCALTSGGAVKCWGYNSSGQLGDGTTTNRLTLVPTVGFCPPAADLTRDGRSDVVWHHATGGDVWMWPMNGTVPLSQNQLGTVADTNWLIHGLGDQTGDGRADLLWRHAASGALFLWTMGGTTVTAQTYLGAVVTDYAIVGTADYTGDGRADILWRHQTSGEVWLWQMNGATLESVTAVATIAPAYAVVASGDLNGDGNTDLLWRHQTSGDVWAWLMNGAVATSQVHLGAVSDLGHHVVGMADHNRDGRADVLWHHVTSGDVWLWQMDGASITAITRVATVSDTNFRVVAVGDYDGDGRADVLWHHATTGAVWVWLMNGATIASATWVATVPDVGYQVVNPR